MALIIEKKVVGFYFPGELLICLVGENFLFSGNARRHWLAMGRFLGVGLSSFLVEHIPIWIIRFGLIHVPISLPEEP